MRVFLKIILFPISIVLTIFIAVASFLVEKISILLNIISGVIFLGALVSYSQYFFGIPFAKAGNMPTLQFAILATAFGFLLSPYGLPTFTLWLIEKLADLNYVIKSI